MCVLARRIIGMHEPGTTCRCLATSNRGIKRSTGSQIVALVDGATGQQQAANKIEHENIAMISGVTGVAWPHPV
jgi:hypothetical protein